MHVRMENPFCYGRIWPLNQVERTAPMASSPPVYLLTNCAACAAPLAHNAPRCVRCFTRYCDSTCQQDHWRRGHKQMCKKIHRGGNAEQYYADKKYKEAVAAAVEACAADRTSTRGTSAAGCASPFPKPPKRTSVLTKRVF